jgi:hypothetical protein
MNLAGIVKRLEALEEQRKAAEKKPWVAVRRIWDGGKLISEHTWKDGKQIQGYTGPIDVVLNRIIIDPMLLVQQPDRTTHQRNPGLVLPTNQTTNFAPTPVNPPRNTTMGNTSTTRE